MELHNGCLALVHANLFISSILGGLHLDSGQINKDKCEEKMNLATDELKAVLSDTSLQRCRFNRNKTGSMF